MIARTLLWLIALYQRTLSPLIGPVCRFEPSCSRYTATCIERFGAALGMHLGLLRLLRCQPFHAGGIDLPPELSPPPSQNCDSGSLSARSSACSHAEVVNNAAAH